MHIETNTVLPASEKRKLYRKVSGKRQEAGLKPVSPIQGWGQNLRG